jgi:PhnB protein
MAQKVKPIPDGYHTLTPYFVVNDAARAIDFYRRAFGATELFRMPGPDGRVMHAELQVGDSRLMLSDESPEMGAKSPATLKGTPVSLLLYVTDVDASFKQAVAAGAKDVAPPADMFWGDRWARVADPFGHEWQIATHKEDVPPEEMPRRAAAAYSQK